MSRQLVFVYGSLLRGLSNHRFLVAASFVGAGVVRGLALYDYSPGCFPAAVRDDELAEASAAAGVELAVTGELYEVAGATFAALDRLESHPRFYQRRKWGVELSDQRVTAWIYLLHPDKVVHTARIESGSWKAHLAAERDRQPRQHLWGEP